MNPPLDFEKIAVRIHQFYFDKYGSIFPRRYPELPEYMKADNRAAARRIELVLKSAGLRLAPNRGVAWSTADQQDIRALIESNLEILAEAEHDGWVETRIRQGWRFVETDHAANPSPAAKDLLKRQATDDRLQTLLIPFRDLADHEKNKDRDSVRCYVEIIAQTDYKIEVS
jgi:plasmid stabilization system protein ParE